MEVGIDGWFERLTRLERDLANHDPVQGEGESQLDELADPVVKLYRRVTRYLEYPILQGLVDYWVAVVVLAADAEVYAHLCKHLKLAKKKKLSFE